MKTLFIKKIPIDFNNGTSGIVNNSTSGIVKIDMDAIRKEVKELSELDSSNNLVIKNDKPIFETIENDFYVLAFETSEN